VILYDGVCIFCSRWVRFVATRDVERRFPLHRDPVGLRHAAGAGFRHRSRDPDTNAVVHGGVRIFKSDAALTVLAQLPGWGGRALFRRCRKPLRDAVYSLVARNRYRIFGSMTNALCPMRICGRG
jgi:predicted DCC family thiol-disulfide oxidoreductase YuxK